MKGRPSKYTQELADHICTLIATTTKGVTAISKEVGINQETIYGWLKTHEDFAKNYARAKEIQMDLMAQEILDISDDSSQDTIETEKGTIPNNEWINRSRLRVDTRKWLMSKLAPKKYGDKQTIEHDGGVNITWNEERTHEVKP